MNRMKKLAALVLALMMAFSTLVMPAMAAENDGIMPRMPITRCPHCGGGAEILIRQSSYYEDYWYGCSESSGSHWHTVYTEEEEVACLETDTCGKTELLGFTPIKEYCPISKVYIYY